MPLLEKLSDSVISGNVIKVFLTLAASSFVTLWLGVCVTKWDVVAPLAVMADLCDYLGIRSARTSLDGAQRWCADPQRRELFHGAAGAAFLMFNLSDSRYVTFRNSAALYGWLLTLVAVQGVGGGTTFVYCISLTLGLFVLVTVVDGRRGRARWADSPSVSTLAHNARQALFAALLPVFVVLAYAAVIYDEEA